MVYSGHFEAGYHRAVLWTVLSMRSYLVLPTLGIRELMTHLCPSRIMYRISVSLIMPRIAREIVHRYHLIFKGPLQRKHFMSEYCIIKSPDLKSAVIFLIYRAN